MFSVKLIFPDYFVHPFLYSVFPHIFGQWCHPNPQSLDVLWSSFPDDPAGKAESQQARDCQGESGYIQVLVWRILASRFKKPDNKLTSILSGRFWPPEFWKLYTSPSCCLEDSSLPFFAKHFFLDQRKFCFDLSVKQLDNWNITVQAKYIEFDKSELTGTFRKNTIWLWHWHAGNALF